MQKSDDEKFLAAMSGKYLVMNKQKHSQLFIFKKNDPKKAKTGDPFYNLQTTVWLEDISFFE